MTEKTLKIRIKMHTPSDVPESNMTGAEEPEANSESYKSAKSSDRLHMGVVAAISGVVMLTLAFIFLNLRDRDEPLPKTDIAATTSEPVTESPSDSGDYDKNAALLSVLEQERVATTSELAPAPTTPPSAAEPDSKDTAAMAASSQTGDAINEPGSPAARSDPPTGLQDQPPVGPHAEADTQAPSESSRAVSGEQRLGDAPAANTEEAIESDTAARPQTSRIPSNQGAPTQSESVAASTGTAQSASRASAPTARIARAQFTNGVRGREPIDLVESVVRSNGQTAQQLYYFTELRNLKGETVTHRWEHEGQQVAEVSFNVGGNRWRVFSSKSLPPNMTGEWQVVVTNTDGEPLTTASFVYQEP